MPMWQEHELFRLW